MKPHILKKSLILNIRYWSTDTVRKAKSERKGNKKRRTETVDENGDNGWETERKRRGRNGGVRNLDGENDEKTLWGENVVGRKRCGEKTSWGINAVRKTRVGESV